MKTENDGHARKKQPPLSPDDALSMLRSAVGYVQQAGLEVTAGTVDGALVLRVMGAQADRSAGTVRFIPVPALEEVLARDAGTVEAVPA